MYQSAVEQIASMDTALSTEAIAVMLMLTTDEVRFNHPSLVLPIIVKVAGVS
jgi:hypothetical protein